MAAFSGFIKFGWTIYLEVNFVYISISISHEYLLLSKHRFLQRIAAESNSSSPLAHLSLYVCMKILIFWYLEQLSAQKLKFSIKDFFSKCHHIRRKLRIWSHLLKKSLMENFIFCEVTLSAFVDPVGDTLAIFKSFSIFGYGRGYHHPLGLMSPLNDQKRRSNGMHILHQRDGCFYAFLDLSDLSVCHSTQCFLQSFPFLRRCNLLIGTKFLTC